MKSSLNFKNTLEIWKASRANGLVWFGLVAYLSEEIEIKFLRRQKSSRVQIIPIQKVVIWIFQSQWNGLIAYLGEKIERNSYFRNRKIFQSKSFPFKRLSSEYWALPNLSVWQYPARPTSPSTLNMTMGRRSKDKKLFLYPQWIPH